MTYVDEWETIRKARGPRVEVPLHICGDHGGGGYYMSLRFDGAHGFHVEDSGPWGCDWSKSPPRRTVRLPDDEE